jgi:hypothetical protein
MQITILSFQGNFYNHTYQKLWLFLADVPTAIRDSGPLDALHCHNSTCVYKIVSITSYSFFFFLCLYLVYDLWCKMFGLSFHQISIEVFCLLFLGFVTYATCVFMTLGPIFASMKKSSVFAQNITLVMVVWGLYGVARVYLYSITKGCDKVLSIVYPKDRNIIDGEKVIPEGVMPIDSNVSNETDAKVLRTVLLWCSVTWGPILFYFIVPGAGNTIDIALAHIFGDVPSMIWAAGLKERTRVWVLLKRFFGLFVGYFGLLLLAERAIAGVFSFIGFGIRRIRGISTSNKDNINVEVDAAPASDENDGGAMLSEMIAAKGDEDRTEAEET